MSCNDAGSGLARLPLRREADTHSPATRPESRQVARHIVGDRAVRGILVVRLGRLDQPDRLAETADLEDALRGEQGRFGTQVAVDQSGLVGGVQAERRLAEQPIPHARHRGQRRPVLRRQAGQAFLKHGRATGDVEHFQGRGQVRMLDQGRGGEALAELVGTHRVLGFRFRQVPQHGFAAAPGIEYAIDRLAGADAEPVHHSRRPEHQAVEVAGFDQGELIEGQVIAGQQHLPQGPRAAAGLRPAGR